jgi:hypothetical protein
VLERPRQGQSRHWRLQRDRCAESAFTVDYGNGNTHEARHVFLVVDPNAFRIGSIQFRFQQVHVRDGVLRALLQYQVL